MNSHQSYVFLQDLSNSFHRWFNLSNFHPGVSQQFMVVFLMVILNIWRSKKSLFLQILSVLSKMCSSILVPSSHNCFRLWESFSPIRSNSGVFSVSFSGAIISELFILSVQLSFSNSFGASSKYPLISSYLFVLLYLNFPKYLRSFSNSYRWFFIFLRSFPILTVVHSRVPLPSFIISIHSFFPILPVVR